VNGQGPDWTARTVDERLVLAHFRGWAHDVRECPLCGMLDARQAYGYGLAIKSIAEGR
jgi:hypothetical protein